MKKHLKKLKNEKRGITLVVLVITIIILLILAGISISVLTGINGIINKAGEAKNAEENLQKKEDMIEIVLELQNKKDNSITPDKAVEDIKNRLDDKYGNDDVKVWAVNSSSGPIIRIDFNENESYILYDGEIEENTEYTSETGTIYRKFEVNEGTSIKKENYKNCDEMIALLAPNYTMSHPYNFFRRGLLFWMF